MDDASLKMLKNCFVYVSACVGSGLRTQLIFMCMQICSYVRRTVLEALHAWEWAYVREVLFVYVGFDPHM